MYIEEQKSGRWCRMEKTWKGYWQVVDSMERGRVVVESAALVSCPSPWCLQCALCVRSARCCGWRGMCLGTDESHAGESVR